MDVRKTVKYNILQKKTAQWEQSYYTRTDGQTYVRTDGQTETDRQDKANIRFSPLCERA
jgi:hypothetical protein